MGMLVDRIFNAVDLNEDGSISLDEFLAKRLDKAPQQFDRIDTDDDQLISLDELQAASHHDWDENIDMTELKNCVEAELDIDFPNFLSPEERFSTADTNEDGFLDMDEFVAAKTLRAEERFNKIDLDSDGLISKAELTTAFKKLYAFRKVLGTCIQQQKDMGDVIGD